MEKKIILVTIVLAFMAVVSSELQPAKCTGQGCSVEHQLRPSGKKSHPPPSSRLHKVQKTAVRQTPTPGQPKPTPRRPKPTSGQPKPTPGHPKPMPEHPKPTSGQPKPTPGHPRPTPGHLKPMPEHPKPTSGQPKPMPEHPKLTPGQPKPTPGYPRPTPGQPKPTPDHPMWSFKSPADKVSFLGSFYRLVLDIHQADKMRHNLTTDKARNRTSLKKEMEVKLSKLIHKLFEKTLHGAKLLAHSKLSSRDLAEINDKKQQEFALFKKTVFSRLKGNSSISWKDMVISRKLKWENSTLYDGFIRENLRNVSHAFQVTLNGWLKKRPTSHIEHMAYVKRPCLKDCKKLRQIVAFCKAQHQECSNDKRRDENGVKESASVKRPKPSQEAYKACAKEKKRCPLQYQCVPKNTPCIDDRDIFKDVGDDVIAGRLPGILSKADRDGSLRTPRLQPSMGLHGGLNEREREIIIKAGTIGVARIRSLMVGVMPTAAHGPVRKIRPSVMPELLSKLKDQQNGDRSHAISPSRSSSESYLNMDHNCSSLCSNKNMSFCWAEMRCKKRGLKCGIKHLIKMMNSTNMGQSPNCHSGEFFCPIFMKCTKTRMECDPKRFYKLCGSNETCRPRNESRGLNASQIEDEDKIFRLRCRVGRKYCPERSGCVNRNDSCSDDRKLGFPSLKDAANEKKIYCRLSDFICPRLYSYWRVMDVGCKKALNDSDYRKRDNTYEREVLKSLRPKPSAIRPSASRPLGKPKKPKTTIEEGNHQSVMKSRFVTLPMAGSLVVLEPRYPLADQIKEKSVSLIAVAIGSRNAPVQWKCSLKSNNRKREGEDIKNVEFPTLNNKGRMSSGLILPSDCKLSFVSTSASFHGAVILKYYVLPGQQQRRPFSAMSVSEDARVLELVALVLPAMPQCKMKLVGKDHKEMFENDKNPPSMKIKDVVNSSSPPVIPKSAISASLISRINKEILAKYMQKLDELRSVRCQIAIVDYEGNPWQKGNWSIKTGHHSWQLFPPQPNRDKPLKLLPNDLIKFSPKLNFHGRIRISLALMTITKTKVTNIRQNIEELKEIVKLDRSVVHFWVNVKGRPILTTVDSCFSPLPFKVTHSKNVGEKVSEVIAKGKRSCTGFKQQSGRSLLEYPDGIRGGKVGIAIVRTPNREHDGHWEYKTQNGVFKRIQLAINKQNIPGQVPGFLLAAESSIRFVPKNLTKLWSTMYAWDHIWLKFHLVYLTQKSVFGPCNISKDSTLFSKRHVQLALPRRNCDDEPGLMTVKYVCNNCQGHPSLCNIAKPSPAQVCPKRDCFKRCFSGANETSENVLDSCGKCQMRKYFINPRDCNGDCISKKQTKPCTNKCGFCVGGKTGKSINFGMNACGGCKSNSSSSCSKKMILDSDGDVEVNEQFEISVKVEGFFSLRYASCSLYGPNGQSSVKELGQRRARILIKKDDSPAKRDENSCDDSAGGVYLVRYEEVTLKNAGEYRIKCSVDNVMYVVGGRKLKAITTSSSIAGYQPSLIKMGIKSTVIVKGSGFQNTSSLSCIAVNEDNLRMSKIKAKFFNESTVACFLPSFNIPGRLQLNVFSSAAVKRSVISKSGPRLDVICPYPRAVSGDMIKGLRKFQIKLDKRAVCSAVKGKKRFDCRSVFSQNTVAKFGNAHCALMGSHIYVDLPVDSKIIQVKNVSAINVVINNENLRCQWTKYSRAIGPMSQNIRIKLPTFEIKAVIRGERSIDACDKVILSGSKSIFGDGGKRIYSWKLFEDGAVVSTKEGASFFRVEGSKLMPNKKYKVNLCVSNILGQENCAEHQLTLTSNQPNKIHVRIPGPDSVRILASQRFTVRPAIKFIQCGKRQKTSEINFMWEVSPKDGVKLERKDRRVLTIKPGNLKPQTNYTLYLFVRAVEDKVETAQASVKLQVAGAPLRAKIRGGQEMTVGCYDKIVLDARQSSDPAATREEGKYVWDCLQKGKGSCSKSSNPDERLVLEEKKRVYLNVNGNLECNQSYIFNLKFSKDSRSSSASIIVKTKPGHPAEVKLDQRIRRNLMILNGFVKTKSPAVADWSCLPDEGFQNLDLNDESLVRRGRVRAMNVGSKVWRPRLIILLDKLPPNTAFKIRLSAKNHDGESNAAIVVKSASPPEKGDLKVSPSIGTALNTSFTLSADEGWQEIEGDFNYEYGYIEKGRRGTKEVILKQYVDKNYIDSIQLPPGDEENNSTLTLYVKVKNGQGLWTRATKQVQVKKLDVIESEKVKEIMAESDQAITEQDYEKANQMITNVLKTAGGDKLVDGVSMKDDLTKKALTILKTAAATDTKMTFPTLELTTKPSSNGALLLAETRNKVANAAKNSIVEIPLIVVNQNSKRKRRSVENSEASSAFTPKSKEEVDSVMTIFDNIIDENDTSNLQDDMKANFTATTPSLLRSLCAGLIQSGEFSMTNNNLSTLRANRVAGDTFNINSLNLSDAQQGPALKLGAYLQQKYEQWNCSDSGLACTELCVGTVLYHHNLYRSDHPNRIADIVNIHLIHPDAYSLVDPGILQSPVQLSMKLNEIPDSNHKIECQTWKSSNWTSEGCTTSYKESGYALCNCSSITNITVFKVAVQPAASTQARTATPSTYTKTEDSTVIISASTPALLIATHISEASVQPRGSETLLTSASEPASTSMQPTTSTVASPKEPASIQVVFSFPVDYNTYAAGGKADQFKQDIMNMLTTKLHVSKNRILNLEIKSGSIIVSFKLIENSGSPNEDTLSTARTKLEKMAADGNLNITLTDGSVLTADPLSLKFSSPHSHPRPHKKEDSKKPLLLIVVISVLVVVLLVLVFARLFFVHKGRRTKVDPDRPMSARSLVVDTIQLEEKPKQAKMTQDYEETNKSSENLITVGIGSSASLKHSPLPNC